MKHLGERLRPALIGHLERSHEVLAEPRRKRAKMLRRLVLVDLLIGSGGVCRLLACAGVQLQRRIERGVTLLQPKEHLVTTLLVLEVRRFEGLQREEIKVTLRRDRRALVRRSEEQVSAAPDLAFPPLELVLPDAVAADVRLIGALHHARQRVEVVAVEEIAARVPQPSFR